MSSTQIRSTGLTHLTQGISETADITPEYCTNMHTVFDERNRFEEVGGYPALNQALALPMVLVMSIWNDVSLMLDSDLSLRSAVV